VCVLPFLGDVGDPSSKMVAVGGAVGEVFEKK
jgi:hypothetical protein